MAIQINERPVVGVRMDKEVYDFIQKQANKEGRSKSNYIEQLIRKEKDKANGRI